MLTFLALVALVTGFIIVCLYAVRAVNRWVDGLDDWEHWFDFVGYCISMFAGLSVFLTAVRVLVVALVLMLLPLPAGAKDLFCGIGDRLFCQAQYRLQSKVGGSVHMHHEWMGVALRIVRERPAIVRLEGQSQGCVSVLKVADYLAKRNIAVDTLICLDGASVFGRTFPVPRNVRYVAHWRQDVGLGGARLCRGKTEGNICREWRGGTMIYEETLRPRTLLFDHYMVGLDPDVQRKAAELMGR